MWSRFKSPVIWGVALSVGVAEFTKISQKGDLTQWDIPLAVMTVLVAMFGAVNNPTDKNNI